MCACPQRRGGSQYARERTGAAAASAGDSGPVLSCSTTGTCVAYTELRRAVQSTLGAVTPLWLEGSRDSLCGYYASMRACACCVSTDTPAVACMGRTESKAALRTFGTAAGPHAGTQRIRPNVHASGCSGGRGTCFLPDPTAPPLQLVQSWTSPSPAQLVPPDAFQGAPAKSESVIKHTQLTRQPRSAAVSGTLANLRVTLTLLDRRRARRGDEYAHISTMTSLHRGNCPHLYRD